MVQYTGYLLHGERIRSVDMRFCRHLYCSESLKKRKRKIIWKIKHNAGQISVYVITISDRADEQLEIFHSGQLLQRYYKIYPPCIVGIADGYGEAIELIKCIAQEVYQKTGGLDIKRYLKDREGRL